MAETKVIDEQAAKSLIDIVGSSLGYDYTYSPVYPETRRDVCAVSRMVENGSTYGYNEVYLVYLHGDGKLKHRKLMDTRDTKDYVNVDSVVEDRGDIVVGVSSGGSFSGSPWKKSLKVRQLSLELE